jgi:hypothetical protein
LRANATTRFVLLGCLLSAFSFLWAQDLLPAPKEKEKSLVSDSPSSPGELPDSPGSIRIALLVSQEQPSQQIDPKVSAPQTAEQQNSASISPAQQAQSQPSIPQKPVGTAVAEPSGASGVAASEPAGSAIAPAKQRRVRTIVLRVGAIVGAGVAVGTIVGLSEATSSKPPGAH